MKTKIIISLILLSFSILIAFSFNRNLTPYLTVSEVVERGYAKNVQVNGTIVIGSTHHKNNTLIFTLTDGRSNMTVYYNGVISNYEEGIKVVVRGDYKNGIFYAKKIYTRCPSKYEVK